MVGVRGGLVNQRRAAWRVTNRDRLQVTQGGGVLTIREGPQVDHGRGIVGIALMEMAGAVIAHAASNGREFLNLRRRA